MRKRKTFFLGILFSFIVFQAGCAFVPFYSQKTFLPRDEKPLLYRGVFHVHSTYSHDSKASLEFIRQTAKRARLDFVVVTDHNTLEGMKSYKKEGDFSAPLLIFGNEISTVDGHLIALGVREPTPGDRSSENLIHWIHRQGGYAVLAHPTGKKKPWSNWQVQDWDGMEVYNFADDFHGGNKIKIVLKAIFLSPDSFLSRTAKVPRESLKVWRGELKSRLVAAFGGTNAHLKVKLAGWTPENFLLYLKSVTTYVYTEQFEEKALTQALGEGRSFVALEAYGSAKDFSFSAKTPRGIYWPGDRLTLEKPALLLAHVPKKASIQLFHNGELLKETTATELEVEMNEPGNYHVEIYDRKKLWIFSNPIYVE